MKSRKSSRQKPHLRRSKKGKKFVAGRGKRKMKAPCTVTEQRQIMKENYESIADSLKKSGKARIPDIGIISVKTKKGIKKGTMVFNPETGMKQPSKGRPKRRVVKFRASKPLLDRIN